MDTDVLRISEGSMQDDAGNLVLTSCVDLREPGSRTPIRTLVKGCRRKHALEDSETIQMSELKEFRAKGKNLIRDPQEGFAKEEWKTVKPETPEQALQRRKIEDLNEASELADAEMKLRRNVTHRSVEGSSESLAFGKEWWNVSTAITPETDEEWATWRATLDPDYDHESVIGQQAERGVALGAVPASDLRPARTLARVGAVAGQRTSPVRVVRTARKPCIAPRPGSNVSLAGEPRLVAKVHRPWPSGVAPARGPSPLVPNQRPHYDAPAAAPSGTGEASRAAANDPGHLRMAPTREPAVHNHPPGIPCPPFLVKSLLPMAIAQPSVRANDLGHLHNRGSCNLHRHRNVPG